MEMEKIYNLLNQLINLIGNSDTQQIELEYKEGKENLKVVLIKNYNLQNQTNSNIENLSLIESTNKDSIESSSSESLNSDFSNLDSFLVIRAPISGNFYLYPFPSADPFIEEGQQISKGQIVCIIESMKVLNEIESPYNGKVKKILVENSKFVNEGDPLIVLE